MTDAQPVPGDLAGQLRRLLAAYTASGRASLPADDLALLQLIVATAARLFGAAAASVLLVDEAEQMLEFKVATGTGSEEIIGRRIPVDQGIAGYVAMTGEPIAVSNVQADPRFKQDFAKSTGYVPRSILATPLISDGRVIGVMEVLDKIEAAAFGLEDMELLGVFAQQAALAIHQWQQHARLGEALMAGLSEVLDGAAQPGAEALRAALAAPNDDDATRDLSALAALFYGIAGRGPAERKACLQILAAFAQYVDSGPDADNNPLTPW
jgi:GAF domain-containing protein